MAYRHTSVFTKDRLTFQGRSQIRCMFPVSSFFICDTLCSNTVPSQSRVQQEVFVPPSCTWSCEIALLSCTACRYCQQQSPRLAVTQGASTALAKYSVCGGRVAQSVQRLATGWTVRDRIPVRTRFSARPDRPWGPPSLLYNGYRVFPGGRGGRGVRLTPHPIQCRGPRKSRAIPLFTLRACVAYKTYQSVCNMIYVQVTHNGPGVNQEWTCRQPRLEMWKCKLISGTPFLQG